MSRRPRVSRRSARAASAAQPWEDALREPPPDLCSSEVVLGDKRFLVLSFALDAGRVAPDDGLTDAERAVSALAAAGLGNAEIARRRGTSIRTVANQLASVYRKLGIDGRAGLRPRGPERGHDP